MKVGANYLGNGRCEFVVWAPLLKKVELQLVPSKNATDPLNVSKRSIKPIPMDRDEAGYWRTVVETAFPGTQYFYRLDEERDRPDPASHFQPYGVHGPSEVVDHASFIWEDRDWRGVDLSQMIIYELHVGTFTPDGRFDAIVQRLRDLKDLGVNAIEIMPVAQFPGERNWGYDGVYPFAVQNSYGGPEAFKKLINECHREHLAVILDAVYNHLGPEGNYLSEFGPYFLSKCRTRWGEAINFDDPYSDDVRNFFIENALHWFERYHIDALRLDAIHAIYDLSARPFLQELTEKTERLSEQGRKRFLIAESNRNDSKAIRPRERDGYGLDAQWCDDFHHAIHALLTGETDGYYADFGAVSHLAKSLREGYVYTGQYSKYRKRSHGNSSKDRPADQFVVFSQNHDQVGNRMLGERLSGLISFEGVKLAAGLVLLSPYVPLLFMGEEYGERAPFLYFVSHSDADLVENVARGRKNEFKAFAWKGEPPNPQDVQTFLRSKLNWQQRSGDVQKGLLNYYQNVIRLRKEIPALSNLDKNSLAVEELEEEKMILMRRWKDNSHVFYIVNFSDRVRPLYAKSLLAFLPKGTWRKVLDSLDPIWNGPGTLLPEKIDPKDQLTIRPHSLALYIKEIN